jgi:hypothetical protein
MELNQNFFPAESQSQTVYGLIRIKPEENAIKGRASLDLKFLLDRSSSMGDMVNNMNFDINTVIDFLFSKKKGKNLTKLDLLKIAVNHVIDRMELNDMISIITFDCKAKEIVSKVIKKGEEKNDIKNMVKKIRTGSATNMSEALKIALNDSTAENKVKRIIIFTDGEVNSPSVDEEEKACIDLAKKAKKLKIPFSLFGTGITYNDKFMEKLADITTGRMEHISNPSNIIDIFNEEIGVLGDIAITNLEGTIQMSNGILKEVSKVVPDIHQMSLTSPDYLFMPLGNLDRARGQAILFQLEIPSLSEGIHEIGTMEVKYDIPLYNITGQKADFKLHVNCIKNTSLCRVNQDVLKTVQLAGATKLQTLAMDRADGGDTRGASKMLCDVYNLYTKLGQTELATNVKTLTNAIKTEDLPSSETKDMRRTLTTRAKQSVGRTLMGR